MKKFILSIVCIFSGLIVFSQNAIDFKDLTLDKALEQAKQEGKPVFFDAYAVWCGPCKYMDKEILSQEQVYSYINENFISIKCDMEKGEGPELRNKYNIHSYPTYMIVQPDGTMQHKIIGGTKTAEDFLEKLKSGMDINQAVGILEKEYENGNRNLDFMIRYTKALTSVREYSKAGKIANELLAFLSDDEKYTQTYWFIFEDPDLSPLGSLTFNDLLKHKDEFYKTIGKDAVDRKILSTFDTKLSNIVVGRDRQSTIDDVASISEYMKPHNFTGKENMEEFVVLILAQKTNNIEKMLTALEKVAPRLTDQKLNAIYFSPAFFIRQHADKKQQKRLVTLSNKLLAQATSDRFKNSLERFIKLELGEKMTTGVTR